MNIHINYTSMKINHNGLTNFIQKPFRPMNLKFYAPPLFSGTYGIKVHKVKAALQLFGSLQRLGKYKGYMITLSFPHTDSPETRFEKKKRLLDNLRKKPEVQKWLWVTELHKGVNKETGEVGLNYGTFHFHIYVLTTVYWDYTKVAQGFSKTYELNCDIGAKDHPEYLAKYLYKDCADLKYIKRLWGYKGLPKSKECRMPILTDKLYLEGRCSSHIYTGGLTFHNPDTIAAIYDDLELFDCFPIFDEETGEIAQ